MTSKFTQDMMADINQRMSSSTAYSTWYTEWHQKHLEHEGYLKLYQDLTSTVLDTLFELYETVLSLSDIQDIIDKIMYIISTTDEDTISLVTVASRLDTVGPTLHEDYEDNISEYANLIYSLQYVGIFSYRVTRQGHPVLTPKVAVNGDLRNLLDEKFNQLLPQVGEFTGWLSRKGDDLVPGIKTNGMSSKRKTPLNYRDRSIVSMVSQQTYKIHMPLLDMPYFVPFLTKEGDPLTEKQQEDIRTSYYRFTDMAEIAEEFDEVIQLPTTMDSRGRFYNMATDPTVRLSLRSTTSEGNLTPFEEQLLEPNE